MKTIEPATFSFKLRVAVLYTQPSVLIIPVIPGYKTESDALTIEILGLLEQSEGYDAYWLLLRNLAVCVLLYVHTLTVLSVTYTAQLAASVIGNGNHGQRTTHQFLYVRLRGAFTVAMVFLDQEIMKEKESTLEMASIYITYRDSILHDKAIVISIFILLPRLTCARATQKHACAASSSQKSSKKDSNKKSAQLQCIYSEQITQE